MAKVGSVENQIRALEGFSVHFIYVGPGAKKGRDVRSDKRSLPGYPYSRKRADVDTVAAWVKDRIEPNYGATA